jgi:hypothetical protein
MAGDDYGISDQYDAERELRELDALEKGEMLEEGGKPSSWSVLLRYFVLIVIVVLVVVLLGRMGYLHSVQSRLLRGEFRVYNPMMRVKTAASHTTSTVASTSTQAESCSSFCVKQGYGAGVCGETPSACSAYGSDYVEEGNRHCPPTSEGLDTFCCCNPRVR